MSSYSSVTGTINGSSIVGGEKPSFLWSQFLNLTEVLNRYGFLEGTVVTPDLGRLGAEVKGDNELWVALVLLELDNLFWDQGLNPHHLAAVVGALVSYEPPPGSGEFPETLAISEEAADILDHLRVEVQAPLGMQQAAYKIGVGANLENYYVGLVEAWALGEDWMSLVESSGMQEGDLCNLLRRTLDVLRLIPRLPTLSRAFKRQARSAIKMVGRYPITDTVTYELQAEEIEEIEQEQEQDKDNIPRDGEGSQQQDENDDDHLADERQATVAEEDTSLSSSSSSSSAASPAAAAPSKANGVGDRPVAVPRISAAQPQDEYDEESEAERILRKASKDARRALGLDDDKETDLQLLSKGRSLNIANSRNGEDVLFEDDEDDDEFSIFDTFEGDDSEDFSEDDEEPDFDRPGSNAASSSSG